MKTTTRDVKTTTGISWLAYYPGLYYRDLPLPVDPHHTEALRQRDLEIFVANRGTFARRPIPHEFADEVMELLDAGDFVAVSFYHDKWRRQLAKQRVTLPRSRRKGKQ